MKHLAILFFLFIRLAVSAQAPLVKQWDYRYGGTLDDYLTCFESSKDGGYILGGYSLSANDGDKSQTGWGNEDYWIVKINSSGIKQWDKRFGGSGIDELTSLKPTADGGYIIGGTSFSGASGDKTQTSRGYHDFWILKIDSFGNKLWDKRFGGQTDDYLNALQPTTDGGYILGGYSYSGFNGDKTQFNRDVTNNTCDYWIVKVDSVGTKQWDGTYGGNGYDYLYSLNQTFDGGYFLAGTSNSNVSGDKTEPRWGSGGAYYDYWVVKIDSEGTKQWDKRFGGEYEEFLRSTQCTLDGGYILAGISWSDSSGNKTEPALDTAAGSNGSCDFWIVKIDYAGTKQWEKQFGGMGCEREFGNITQTNDGGYLLAGSSDSKMSRDKTENNNGFWEGWIVKCDSSGSKIWDKTIFSPGGLGPSFAIRTPEGCYVIANSTPTTIGGYKTQPSWGNQSSDYWIVKLCDSASSISGIENITEADVVSVYPNPTQNNWQLTVGNSFIGGTAEIFDSKGQLIYKSLIVNSSSLIAADVSRGVYLLRISSGKSSVVRKLIRL